MPLLVRLTYRLHAGSGINNGKFEEWFHGVITRKDSEDLLKGKPAGTFLVSAPALFSAAFSTTARLALCMPACPVITVTNACLLRVQVRVSESRFGYSLSHMVRGGARVKHYMIDQTPDGQYQVRASNHRSCSLSALQAMWFCWFGRTS